jgi:membrane protease YdiL (CAAX protease family)
VRRAAIDKQADGSRAWDTVSGGPEFDAFEHLGRKAQLDFGANGLSGSRDFACCSIKPWQRGRSAGAEAWQSDSEWTLPKCRARPLMRAVRFLTLLGIPLALLGPGAVAFLSVRYAEVSQSLAIRSFGLLAFVALVAGVVLIARRGEHLAWSDVGFGRTSWASVGWAGVLLCFLVFVFGPLAAALLAHVGVGSFDADAAGLRGLPLWYLILTIVLVAAGEEWLYRGYAIERLAFVFGHIWPAAMISLIAFTAAHIPMWGVAPSLNALLGGAVFTALYVWRRDVTSLILAHVATDLYGLVIAPALA